MTLAERWVVMPTYRLTVINQTFTATDEHELPSLDEARKRGIRAALDIGAEEVTNGNPFFGAEVRVQDGDEEPHRFMVSVGASPLQSLLAAEENQE